MAAEPKLLKRASLSVDVQTEKGKTRLHAIGCIIGEHISFSTEALESFAFRNWSNVVYDAMVVAAAIEFCDRSLKRPALNWGREFSLRIPVHDPARWSQQNVQTALISAINLLMGDSWNIEFVPRATPYKAPRQTTMEFPRNAQAVIAYSEGMDSRAVAGLERAKIGDKLVLVRIGGLDRRLSKFARANRPFTAIPYKVTLGFDNAEATARSRGFKFAMVAALGAYLIGAKTIIVPESGQGALAPALLPVGQAYPDYRSHPHFTSRMKVFIEALLGITIQYEFPRLWHTKGETLREYTALSPHSAEWIGTRSCWQQPRQTAFDGDWRQCGICAACLLRRLSVHAAGLHEPTSKYVWEDLKAETFHAGVHPAFPKSRISKAMHEYALAGTLHFDQLAKLRQSGQYGFVKGRAQYELAHALQLPLSEVSSKMDGFLQRHEYEWKAFSKSWGSRSFLNAWIS